MIQERILALNGGTLSEDISRPKTYKMSDLLASYDCSVNIYTTEFEVLWAQP